MRAGVLSFLVLTFVASTATATESTLSWAFQSTGFQSTSSGLGAQTALAMRDGGTWPIIFSTQYSGVQAYTLTPVSNPAINPAAKQYWQKVGYNLLYDQSGNMLLSAATSPDGRFGAVLRYVGTSSSDPSQAIVGSTASGFGSTMSGVRAIDFTAQGSLVTGTANTVPGLIQTSLTGIAVSSTNTVGALSSNGYYYEQSGLTGGWGVANLVQAGLNQSLAGYSDLTMDSRGRPYVVGFAGSGSLMGPLAAYTFDIPTAQWKQQILSMGCMYAPLATVAADGHGGVGVAWVQQNPSTQLWSLQYAYESGDNAWTIRQVTSGVYNSTTSSWESICPQQRVGLAFDADDFPVISFVTGNGGTGNIWLAYDPIIAPEPSTLALLVAGGMAMLIAAKLRRRRLGH